MEEKERDCERGTWRQSAAFSGGSSSSGRGWGGCGSGRLRPRGTGRQSARRQLRRRWKRFRVARSSAGGRSGFGSGGRGTRTCGRRLLGDRHLACWRRGLHAVTGSMHSIHVRTSTGWLIKQSGGRRAGNGRERDQDEAGVPWLLRRVPVLRLVWLREGLSFGRERARGRAQWWLREE